MSVTTHDRTDQTADSGSSALHAFNLVEELLKQQQQLTAVEAFSLYHDEGSADEASSEPAQAKFYRSLLPTTAPGPGQQLAFEVDLDACSGCKACVVACHTLNGLEDSESWRKVGSVSLGHSPSSSAAPLPVVPLPKSPPTEKSSPTVTNDFGVQHVTTACHHCEDPGCLNGCPVKAYDKDPVTGIVRHLDDQCIGCKYCTMMCPYEVPKYSKRLGIVRKCDMCHNRLAVGEAPACVQSCPNEAIRIRIVDHSDPAEWPSGLDHSSVAPEPSLAPGAPPSSITRPTTVYRSDRMESLGLPQDHELDEVAESHWPLGALLIATQISVGMLIIERAVSAILRLAGDPMPTSVTAAVATLSLLIGAIGLNLAPLHLGQPLRSWRVFLGLKTSWLSREAVVLGQYVGILSLAVGLFWLPVAEPYLPEAITNLTDRFVPSWAAKLMLFASIPVGLAGLYCSAMIYIATKRPLWRHARTLPRFFGTTLIGGLSVVLAVTLVAAFWLNISTIPVAVTTTFMALAAFAAVVGKLLWEYAIHLGPSQTAEHQHDRRCKRLTTDQLSSLRRIRLTSGFLSALGFAAVAVSVVASGPDSMLTVGLSMIAAVLAILGEVGERLLYFMSVVYDRMPGTLH
ncbi:molybdopterin oxidoreductase [Roseiconus nitratireducens]|uniref:Molybdopterin oxidoreductase n=1 Tax=Roseiconus nitratireducens TaxID=2605748 RepID=A0A5M6D083_9BACT|nr:DmsC/YnfH family molybdoenzyme membrane anchor subunit [Roseiconus nitratireducens]KAA5539702.1 molybdopterin oxidoreductase [Roseiconus nitratireducens]